MHPKFTKKIYDGEKLLSLSFTYLADMTAISGFVKK